MIRATKAWLSVFSAAFMLTACAGGCSGKKMSDRETRREQQRVNAEVKRQELSPASGEFHGFIIQNDQRQDASLRLELKDVPDTSAGDVDPVLIPMLSGSLRLTYGNRGEGSFYSFAIQKADFEPQSARLDLVAANETLKEIVLTLHRTPQGYTGSWTSPSSSAAGTIELSAGDVLGLKGETPDLGGAYDGTLDWNAAAVFQYASINLATTQDKPDRFSVAGNLKLFMGDPGSGEVLQYVTDQIDFNPLTRKLILRGTNSAVYFVGELRDDAIVGSLFSSLDAEIGRINIRRKGAIAPSSSREKVGAVGGAYFLTVSDEHPETHLPKRAMLTLVATPDATHGDNLLISGNIRLYFGNFGSNEFLELPISQSELRLFSRKLVLKAGDDPKITLEVDIGASGVTGGRFKDDAYGDVGGFAASRTLPLGDTKTMGGDYLGYFGWDRLKGHQSAVLTLRPTFSGTDELRLDGTVTLDFGSARDGERLVYVLDAATFDPMTGLAVFGKEGSEINVKGYFEDGAFNGEWTVARIGRMGPVTLVQGALPPPPANSEQVSALKGTFLCRIVNTSAASNLPEHMALGFVTSPDLQNPRGLRVSGNLRLFLGVVGTDEYTEMALEQINFDPFTRRLTAVTSGDLVLTVKAELSAETISGVLTHGTLGDIASFEGTKQP